MKKIRNFLLAFSLLVLGQRVMAQVYPPETYTDRKQWNKVLVEKIQSYDPKNLKDIKVTKEVKDGGLFLVSIIEIDAPFQNVTEFFYRYQNLSFLYKNNLFLVKIPGETDFFGTGSIRESISPGIKFDETMLKNTPSSSSYTLKNPLLEFHQGDYDFVELPNGKTQMTVHWKVKFKRKFLQNEKSYLTLADGVVMTFYMAKSLLEEDSSFYKRITWLDEIIQKKGYPTPPTYK
ncbi:MAG: hypothetical protein C4K58_08275 [Flavobacteriaceae bacterium]|nr:MAG: hypothetical protein C4K58_08275 [Flavobacteriaceae bacterium]